MNPEIVLITGMSGSGKSVAAVALLAALRQDGYAVSPFKKGPDYIDAGWMARAAGRPCYNLDPFLMSPQQILATFREHLAGSDLALIEGNRGLYDGVNATGSYSTAELAILLNLPVLLVVNCAKTTRTVAALVLGCRHFDPRVRIAGVILNQIATPRHERIIRESLAQTTDLPVLGIIPRLKTDIFPMRHLGVTYKTAWRLKHKVMQAMTEREDSRKLQGFVQLDDAYLGGERNGGKPGRGSENKQAFVIAVQTDEHLERPTFAVIEPVRSFDNASLNDWITRRLAPECEVYSDGLACFRRLEDAGHAHTTLDTGGGRAATEVAGARWVNVVLGNLKRAISGTYHAVKQAKYERRTVSTAGSACARRCRDLRPR